MKTKILLAVAFAAVIGLGTGCISEYAGSSYTGSQTRRMATVRYGTITNIREATIQGKSGAVGGIAGGILGAAIGNTIGGGSGRTVATAIGAVGGAAAGAAVQKSAGTERAIQMEIKLEEGGIVSITQAPGKDHFEVGQRVSIVDDGETARVSPM